MNKDKNKRGINYKELNKTISYAKIVLRFLTVFVILALILGFLYIIEKLELLKFIGTILKLLAPLFIGFLISWLLEPLIRRMEKEQVKRKWATTITYVFFILLTVLLLVLVLPEVVNQLRELLVRLPSYIDSIKEFFENFFSKFNSSSINYATIESKFMEKLETSITNLGTGILNGVVGGLTTIVSSIFQIGIGLIIAFYISLIYPKIQKKVEGFIPENNKLDVIDLLKKLGIMSRNYVTGTLISCMIVIVFTFIGLVIAGINSPLLFAVFCGVTNIIPYFGPYIGGIPVVIVGFSISPFCGIVSLITIILVQLVEGNIIHPLIVGKATDIHPISLIIGLIIFEYFFGIVGMILATPIIGGIKILFQYFNLKYQLLNRLKKKLN